MPAPSRKTVIKSGLFRKSKLACGMTLVTESLPHFQSLAIGVWVKAGTRHERSGEEGLSHFLEHMMFKGTARRSALDIAQAVDQVGGEFNAFTSREHTCFHLLLLSRDLKLAADIMSDVLLNSAFAQEEIERERKVILQEIAMVEDNPEEQIHDVFFEQAFGKHPLGKPILGSRETVASFDRATVASYFKRHYAPEQMILSVAGDVSHEEVRKTFDRYLSPFKKIGVIGNLNAKRSSRVAVSRDGMSKPRLKSGMRMLKSDHEQAHLVIGFPSMAYNHPDRFAAFLLNIYLGGGMSSSLFQEIREKRGLAYSIYSSLSPFSDSGLFSVYVGTDPKEVGTCLEITGRELARLRDRALDEKALKILKDNLKGTVLLNSDSVENRMMSIAKSEMFFGKYFSMKEVTRLIERVNTADIQRLARALFRADRLILTVMGPVRGSGLRDKVTKHLI